MGIGYLTNQIDRNLMSVLIEPIRLEFGLTDTEIALVSGFSFALFYGLFGFPLGRAVDRYSRRNLIVLTQMGFSAFTFICGLAQHFMHLVLARVGVAVGEAGSYPAGLSFLTDLFPLRQRTRVMAVFNGFAYLGFLCGFLIGGWVGQFFGWRTAFMVAALPGILISLITWATLREPVRTSLSGTAAHEQPESFRDTFRFLVRQKALMHMIVGATLGQSANVAFTVWLPVVLIRTFGMDLGPAGTYIALIFGIGGCCGTLLIGFLVDHLTKRDVRWAFWIVIAFTMVLVPTSLMMIFSDNLNFFLFLMIIPGAFGATYVPPALAMLQSLAPPRMRGVASSFYMLGVYLVGLPFGVQVVGTLSDIIKPELGSNSVKYALLALIIFPTWSIFHFWRASQYLKNDLANAQSRDTMAKVSTSPSTT
ncbi:MAG: MFS transporter [Novosphingobium sp.]